MIRGTDRLAVTIAVDLGCKATKQTNIMFSFFLRYPRPVRASARGGSLTGHGW